MTAMHTHSVNLISSVPQLRMTGFTESAQSYHYKNFETAFAVPREEIAQNGKPRMVATNSQEILEEHLSEHQNLDRVVSGRLVIN